MTRADTRAPARGFTLVELLVVLGIITFLASVTVVAVWPFMEGRALQSGASTVQALIYQARSYAIANRCNATLYLNAAEGEMVLFASPTAFSGGNPNNDYRNDRADRPEFLPKGVKFYARNGLVVTDTTGTAAGPTFPNGRANVLVFSRTGSLETTSFVGVWPGGMGNVIIRLQDPAAQTTKAVEVMFTSGFPKIYDE